MPEEVTSHLEAKAATSPQGWARWELFALFVLLVVFVGLAAHDIHEPGLYYDEMFVISPATGTPAYTTWFGIPIMISPYVGADKSWLYWPIFAIFGVSAWSIRLPAILISCGTLVLSYTLVRKVLTPGWAIVFSAACAVHPGFIFLSKVDWGPHVLMLFLKALCLLLCFRWVEGAQKTCYSLPIIWVLGFWDKFNFVWFVIALLVATCLIYRDIILLALRRVRPAILLGVAIGSVALGMVTLWIIRPLVQKPATSAFSDRLWHIWTLYKYTGTGMATASMWFKSLPPLPSWTGWCSPALTVIFLALAFVAYVQRQSSAYGIDRRTLRFCLWCLLMFGIIFLEIALTPQAGGAHHTIMLFPFDLLACFSAAYLLVNAISGKARGLILLLQSGILCLWVGSNLESLEMHFRKFRDVDSFHARFSPRIESLASYLDSEGNKLEAIHCVDWGIGMQLAALCKPAVRRHVIDEWMTFENWSPEQANAKVVAQKIFSSQTKAIYLSFTAEEPVMPMARQNFAEMTTLAGSQLVPVPFVPTELDRTYAGFSNYPLSANDPK